MSYQFARYARAGHVATVTLNRPEVLNALHAEANQELADIFNDFKTDPDLWVAIITGAGDRAFCAGNDLKAQAARQAGGAAPSQRRAAFGGITSGFECDKPIIAAVNGYAMGGGCEIVLACDIVVAAEHARFGLPEARVGLIPGAGGIHRLSHQAPLKLAMGMLLSGQAISAQEAYRIGLVNEVVPLADLQATAERWANRILEASPLCVRLIKESVREGLNVSLEEAMLRDRERRLPRLVASADYVEGPRAFAEKRPPRWQGQ